jgi:hypothetical protein
MGERFDAVFRRLDPTEAGAHNFLGRKRATRDLSRGLRGGQRR